jgi:anti-sigma factor RsiW
LRLADILAQEATVTCREFADFLTEYLSGNLSPAEQAIFEEHLGQCPDCVAYLATFRQTIAIGKASYGLDPIRDDLPEELVLAILAARSRAPFIPNL